MATVKGTKQSKDALGAKGKKDQFMFNPEDLVLIEDPKHPLYDERVKLPLKESLVRNIKKFGVIQPIVVRKNPETGKVEVITGRQRVKACREANRRLDEEGCEKILIPAVVRRGEAAALTGVVASENEHREDDTPYGRAQKMQRALDLGRPEEEVMITYGLNSRAALMQNLSLLDASREVRTALQAEKITTTEAAKLIRMEPAAATKALDRLLKEAPRKVGQKRRGDASRAREILNGPDVHEMRRKKPVSAMYKKVESADPKNHNIEVAKKCFEWVLGAIDDAELMRALGGVTVESARTKESGSALAATG